MGVTPRGPWPNEAYLTEEPLNTGMMEIKNRDGVRSSHTDHAEVMLSPDGHPQENSGHVIGDTLCYSGNYTMRIETHNDKQWHIS